MTIGIEGLVVLRVSLRLDFSHFGVFWRVLLHPTDYDLCPNSSSLGKTVGPTFVISISQASRDGSYRNWHIQAGAERKRHGAVSIKERARVALLIFLMKNSSENM